LTSKLGFGRDARLSERRDFQAVFSGSKRVGRWLILWRRDGPPGRAARLGLSVSAKVGGAVRRNRLKRLLREAFRRRRAELPSGLDLVAYPRPGCPWKTLADAEHDLGELLSRTEKTHK
jgi:ribonuclease P protein component